jgi:S-DNA-T family DNA segregation ATPase FtsK/SpoIIIE
VLRDPANAGRAELTIVTCDPLAGAGTPWPWVGAHQTNLGMPVPLGVDEDGVHVWLDLAGHHVLVGGEPGAGKSNALSMIVATAALDPHVELWCLDAKLVELAPWRDLAKAFVGPDIEEATVALGVLQAEMTNRYQWLLEQKLRKVTPDTGLGLVLVVIDELALYIQGKGKERDEFALGLRDLVARGRAAGIVVVAATQKPAADVVPTAVRDLFGYRLALRCSTREASDTVLGSGWAAAGFSAADIDPATRGVGLLLADTGVPTTAALPSRHRRRHRAIVQRAVDCAAVREPAMTDLFTDPRLPEALARLAAPGGYEAFEDQVRGARFCRRPVRLKGSVTRPGPTGPPGALRLGQPTGPGAAESVRDPAPDAVPTLRLDLPGRRLRPGGGRAPWWQGRVPEEVSRPSGRSPHPDRPQLRGGAPNDPGRDLSPLGAPLPPWHRPALRPASHRRGPLLGQAICPSCYDYDAAVLFNASVSELWRRTTIYALRALGNLAGMSVRAVAKEVRLSYVKVVEFQRRGSVHLHALVRLDAVATT